MIAALLVLTVLFLFSSILTFETLNDGTQPRLKPMGLVSWVISGNWPAKVGAAFLIIGIGALLRYAFASISLPPELKLGGGVILSAVLGFVAMLLKDRPQRRAVYLALAGAAFGVAYLTAYSAYGVLNYINDINALGLLALVAIAAGSFAVSSNTVSVAVLAMVGAFIAPTFALDSPGVIPVYGYYLAASVLCLVMVTLRGWRPLIHLSFLFTLAGGLFLGWTGKFYEPAFYDTMQPLLLALTAVHLLMPLMERKHVRSIRAIRFDAAYFVALPLTAASLTLKISPNLHTDGSIGLLALSVIWAIAAIDLYILKEREVPRYAVMSVLLAIAAALCFLDDIPWLSVGLVLSVMIIAAARKLEWPENIHGLGCGAAALFGVLHIIQSITQPAPLLAFQNELFAYRALTSVLIIIGASFAERRSPYFSRALWTIGAGWATLSVIAEVLRLRIDFLPQLSYGLVLAMIVGSLLIERHRIVHPVINGLLLLVLIACGWEARQDANLLTIVAYLILTPAALLGMAWSGRDDKSREGSDFVPTMAIGLLPFTLLPWAIATADSVNIGTNFFEASIGMFGICIAGLSARLWLSESTRWNTRIQPLHVYLTAFLLVTVTLVHIERGIWPIAFELLALSYLIVYAKRRSAEESGLGLGISVMMILSVALVVQAMLLRGFGPADAVLDASDINRMNMPAVASLMWVIFGAGFAWWGTHSKSRSTWSAGSAVLAVAAAKLFLFDFGALGQLANILAFIAAGLIFMGVAWLAPIPPKSAPPNPQEQLSPETTPTPSVSSAMPEGVRQQESAKPAAVFTPSAYASVEPSPQPSARPATRRRNEPKGVNGLWFLFLGVGILVAFSSSAWNKYSHQKKKLAEIQHSLEMKRVEKQRMSEVTAPEPAPPASPAPEPQPSLQVQDSSTALVSPAPIPVAHYNVPDKNGIPDLAPPLPDTLTLSHDPVPRQIAADAEVVLVSGYEPSGKSGSGTTVNVDVNRPGSKVLLVLTSYEKIYWKVSASPSTRISGILVSSYYPSAVWTKVDTQGYSLKLPYAYETENVNFKELLTKLNSLVGVEKLDVFRGSYSIPSEVQISRTDPPSVALTITGPKPQRPSTYFTFNLLTTDFSKVPWTLTGPVSGSQQRAYSGEGKVAVSETGDKKFSLKRDQLEVIDSHRSGPFTVSLPPDFPSFSWPMDLAYDSKRDIVSVVTLGGEGFMYRFDATRLRWIDYKSLDNVDIFSLAYDQKMDRYVAWTDQGSLQFISGDGVPLFKRNVAPLLEGFGRLYDRGNSRAPRITVAPSGNDLALLSIDRNSVKRIWHYDVNANKATLTY